MDHERQHDRVHLQGSTREPDTTREVIVNPPVRHPPRHDGVETKCRGDGCSLEVGGFAGGVLGYARGGDIEARQTGKAAEDEERKAEVVEQGAEADGERHSSGGHAEGYLASRTHISFC
jgi:hypothetical protein